MLSKIFKYSDISLIIAPLLLTLYGIIMIYSSSMVVTVFRYDVPSNYFLLKQINWLLVSLIPFLLAIIIPYKHYMKIFKWIILACLCSLITVLFIGKVAGNAQSWFVIKSVNIQPAEFTKLGLIIYLAAVYAKKQAYMDQFIRGALPPIIFTFLLFLLVYLQPDLGTGLILLMIAGVMIFCSGMQFRHILLLILAGGTCLFAVYKWFLSLEQSSRFIGAYDPFSSPLNEGYHLIHSYIAIGTGGLSGRGLGNSIQKLGYLPEPHTDFIMAIISEELGALGVLFVILVLAYIVLKGLKIARKCPDTFGSLLATGISAMIAIQTFVNLGGVSGLLPITGVTLPFVSYGGSSLVLLMLSMGILVNVSKYSNYMKEKKQGESGNITAVG